MTSQMVLTIGRDALTLLLMISMPVLGVVMAVGLLVSIFQAVTQIHEATLAFVPSVWISLPAMTALSSSRCGLMSISAMRASASEARCSTSPTMFFMNTVEPAPIKVILGLAISVARRGRASLHCRAGR